MTLETLQKHIADGGVKELALIIKADVQGSAEVLADSLQKLGDERIKVRVISSGVGAINESDVLLATASEAIIIGFNVRPDRNAEAVADREKVDIRLHSIIYNVTDEMQAAMAGMLEPTFKDTRIGMAEVREVFKVPKAGTVAGCFVTEGVIRRSGDVQARLLRDGVVVHTGKLSSLRRFKDDVSEVKNGLECGMTFERYNDIKAGDVIEVFVSRRNRRHHPGLAGRAGLRVAAGCPSRPSVDEGAPSGRAFRLCRGRGRAGLGQPALPLAPRHRASRHSGIAAFT